MMNRCLLSTVDFDKRTIVLGQSEYRLNIESFGTVDKEDPSRLSEDEEIIMGKLQQSF